MIGDLCGPVACRRHDSYLLRRSRLHEKLAFHLGRFDIDYLCFGDAAYPMLRYITRGTRRPRVPIVGDEVAAGHMR
jgi:hypothetical protein